MTRQSGADPGRSADPVDIRVAATMAREVPTRDDHRTRADAGRAVRAGAPPRVAGRGPGDPNRAAPATGRVATTDQPVHGEADPAELDDRDHPGGHPGAAVPRAGRAAVGRDRGVRTPVVLRASAAEAADPGATGGRHSR